MKKCFSIIFAFVFFISIASPAFADDIYGWWKSDGKSNMNTILKITDTHFSGLRYKVMENDGVIGYFPGFYKVFRALFAKHSELLTNEED